MISRCRFTAAAIVLAAAAPACAGQPAAAIDLSDSMPGEPSPAASGKPVLAMPSSPLGPAEIGGCRPALPCGTRLLGTVRKNGAIELQVPAWRW